jgi:exodeoxyribonuclease VII large subunit
MSLARKYLVPHESNVASEEAIYSVAEYLALLNVKLRPLKATIQGEIGRIKYSQKAVYFSLYDQDRSVLNCLVWLSRLNSLGIELKEGLEVKLQGYPDIYPQTGLITFKADVITPIGEGALKLAFEKLKKDLEAQGYFRQDRKQALPSHIERIGLITSENGVVIRDFLAGLGNRGLKVSFCDARVEGLNAIEDLVSAIQWFNEQAQDAQVLVIARGGGSLERLQPFNTFELAKAIYSSKIPVMTAIGHELDVTIADLVADVRASVPMDAGQRLAEQWISVGERVQTIEESLLSSVKNRCRELDIRLTNYQKNYLSGYAQQLAQCHKALVDAQQTLMRCFRDILARIKNIEENFTFNDERFSRRLVINTREVDSMEAELLHEATRYFSSIGAQLTAIEEQFDHSATRFRRYLLSLQEDLAAYPSRIARGAERWFATIGKRITECENILLACDPQLKLKQGFSIVTDKSGKIIKSSQQVDVGDIIAVQLSEGSLASKIEHVK